MSGAAALFAFQVLACAGDGGGSGGRDMRPPLPSGGQSAPAGDAGRAVFDALAEGVTKAVTLACDWAIPPATPGVPSFDKAKTNVQLTLDGAVGRSHTDQSRRVPVDLHPDSGRDQGAGRPALRLPDHDGGVKDERQRWGARPRRRRTTTSGVCAHVYGGSGVTSGSAVSFTGATSSSRPPSSAKA